MANEMMIGIDVSKDTLVIDDGSGGTEIANIIDAIDAWLGSLPKGSRIGIEATGGYHQVLADRAWQAGMVVYVLNPRDVRHYAQGMGRRGKTDRVDAAVIRRLVMKEHDGLRPYQREAEVQREVAKLQRRRACVVKHRQALRKSLVGVKGLEEPLRLALEQIDQLLASIDRQLREGLATQPKALAGAQRMETVPGIGEQTSTQLATLFDRVPLDNGDAVVAFVGLDPRPLDSGQKRGRRRLSKRGPGELRRLLYNCAQAAARTTVWKPYYERLRGRGFPATAALVILARKLLRIAFGLWKDADAVFDPKKVTCLCERA
jgi:transposase